MRRFVKSFGCAAALLTAAGAVGQTAAEYQARIRRATEAYRGDCIEGSDVVVYEESYDPVSRIHIPRHAYDSFPPQVLRLLVTFDEYETSTPGSLEHITSNQALELTATRRILTLFDDYVTLGALDARFP